MEWNLIEFNGIIILLLDKVFLGFHFISNTGLLAVTIIIIFSFSSEFIMYIFNLL